MSTQTTIIMNNYGAEPILESSASNIPAVYGTHRFITVFTRAHHQFQSTPSHPI